MAINLRLIGKCLTVREDGKPIYSNWTETGKKDFQEIENLNVEQIKSWVENQPIKHVRKEFP